MFSVKVCKIRRYHCGRKQENMFFCCLPVFMEHLAGEFESILHAKYNCSRMNDEHRNIYSTQ